MRTELRSLAAGDFADAPPQNPANARTAEIVREIQDLMWNDVGIVRSAAGLLRAIDHLERLVPLVAQPASRQAWEAQSLCTTGRLVARCALAREESRGAHYRTDFPAHNDAKFLKHSIMKQEAISFV